MSCLVDIVFKWMMKASGGVERVGRAVGCACGWALADGKLRALSGTMDRTEAALKGEKELSIHTNFSARASSWKRLWIGAAVLSCNKETGLENTEAVTGSNNRHGITKRETTRVSNFDIGPTERARMRAFEGCIILEGFHERRYGAEVQICRAKRPMALMGLTFDSCLRVLSQSYS